MDIAVDKKIGSKSSGVCKKLISRSIELFMYHTLCSKKTLYLACCSPGGRGDFQLRHPLSCPCFDSYLSQ